MAKLSLRQQTEIKTPYSLSINEHKEIKKYGNDWGNRNLKPIKDKIRNYYKKEQGKLCCFCKLPFRDQIHVEHTVPKAGAKGRPEYAFYPKNLSVACNHCNSKKSTNNDMIPWYKKPYPSDGLFFRIIHPQFDNYFQHIRIEDKSRYVPITTKGYRTIERCKLYETNITEVLVKYMRFEDDSLIQGVLRLRELQGDMVEIKNKIDRFFHKIL